MKKLGDIRARALFKKTIWKPSSWLSSALLLRKVRSEKLLISPNIIMIEKNVLLPKEEIVEDFQILPLEHHFHDAQLLKIIVSRANDDVDYASWKIVNKYGSNVGLALSHIISFVMRSLVMPYNGWVTPFYDEEFKTLTGSCDLWFNSFKNIYGLKFFTNVPLIASEHERESIPEINKVYNILMELDEKIYLSIMGAFRLHWLAYYVYLIDNSLSYSFLVASIDAIASPLYKGLTSRKKINKFIMNNMPDDFFEINYSRVKEYGKMMEKHLSNSIKRANVSDKSELEMMLERHKRKQKITEQMIKKDKNWQWKMNYLRDNFEKVLRNTWSARSKVFHSGRDLPQFVFKEDIFDWMPDIFEADYNEFMEDHIEHKRQYSVTSKGKIIRICSCGESKEIKFLLGIRLFEILVQKSILNYILKLEKEYSARER